MTDAMKIETNGEKSLYFTQAELEIMMEIADGPRCLICRAGPPPDDYDLIQALISLYKRGFLENPAGSDRIGPSERGMFFKNLRAAPVTVVLTARRPEESAAVCYSGNGGIIWLLESISMSASWETRLRRMERRRFETWLFDAGILEPPLLTRTDAQELSALMGYEDEKDASRLSDAQIRLRLEKYENGGLLTGAYEILEETGVSVARIREGRGERTEIYTKEALREILDRAFRKGKS